MKFSLDFVYKNIKIGLFFDRVVKNGEVLWTTFQRLMLLIWLFELSL